MAKIEAKILSLKDFDEKRDSEIRNAHDSGGTYKVPLTLRLPGGRIMVIWGLPGEPEIDTDKDVFR